MQLKQLFSEDRAVSPVIGVILMVAITVILAAVIGAFVIGIGGEQDSAPTASIDFSQDTSEYEVTIQHESGATLDAQEISISVDSEEGGSETFEGPEFDDGSPELGDDGWNTEISAGDSVTIEDGDLGTDFDWTDGADADEKTGTVQVVWESSDTDSSSVLADYDYDLT